MKFKIAPWEYLETKDDSQARRQCGLRTFCHSVEKGSLKWRIQPQKLCPELWSLCMCPGQ